jgi:hypothetical protein
VKAKIQQAEAKKNDVIVLHAKSSFPDYHEE